MEGETKPSALGDGPVMELRVAGALAAPVSFEYVVYSGEACVGEFEDAAEQNGWDYVMTPVD